MRLHRLRMTAFGPFPDDVEIDADALAADGLFLLHGQTGAGKSTVLDAVAFALFGRVPGARDINRRLHSDHAPADRVPEVELEATIGGRRLRITRSPDHERPKKRGDGTRKVNARATLVWVDGSGPNLQRLNDIGDAVERLLGMNAEQFFQVVLLPQGEFARFLRASSGDRQKLLEKLFDTERFGDLEEWFRERGRASASELSGRASAVDRLAAQIAVLDGTGLAAPVDADMGWAQTCLDSVRAAEERSRLASAAASASFDRARAEHDEATRHTELHRRGSEAAARLDQLTAGAAELELAVTTVAAARRAAPIAPLVEDLDTALTAVREAEAACGRAESALSETTDGMCLVAEGDDAVREAIDAAATEAGRLDPLVVRIGQRPELVADIDRIGEETAQAGRRATELDGQLAGAPERRAQAQTELNHALVARASVPQLTSDRRRIEAVAAALRARTELAEAQEAAGRTLLDSRSAEVTAREHLLDIRERRLAGMAGELAAELVDGQPCAVCGALEHPMPAITDATRVGEDEESAAAEAAQLAGERRSQAEQDMAKLAERREHLDETIGDATAEQSARELTRLGDELARAVSASERIGELERAVSTIDAQVDAWRTERGQIDTAQAARDERRDGLAGTLAALDADVLEATGGRMDVPERRAALAELRRRATRMLEARAERARARGRRDDVADRLAGRCADAGFADLARVRDAMLTPGEIADRENLIAETARLRAAAEETLADPDVALARETDPVDLPAVAARLETARQDAQRQAQEHAVIADRARGLQECVASFWAALDALAPVQARHAEITGLADLLSGGGQNARRISLHSYVLAARLEEVLVAASERLRQMSSGRYEFVHSDAIGPHGSRGGLGIDVRDEYTGAIRACTTLSGGETFFASLALALGLADVVAAESGGRLLDTMFIDEGFGTLDPEALDLVMGVLDALRAGGRVVGVVSHVDELRARIPSQLHVVRGEDGSRIRMTEPVGVS
ncbi:AAA family ATPase [Gordonia sp. NPDC003424]